MELNTPLLPASPEESTDTKEPANKRRMPEIPKIPIWLTLMLTVCAGIFVQGILFAGVGLGTAAFALAFAGVALLYHGRKEHRTTGLLTLAYGILAAVACAVYQNTMLQTFVFAAMLLALFYSIWALESTHAVGTGAQTLLTWVLTTLLKPFSFLAPVIRSIMPSSGHRNQLLWGLAGLLVSIPILLVVGTLLLSDDSFFNLANGLFQQVADVDIPTILLRVALSLLLGWYFLSLFYCARHNKAQYASKLKAHPLPIAMSSVVLVLLIALYAVFCAVQISSITQVIRRTFSADFTYSNYARNGFFELCLVAVINLSIFLFVQHFSPDRPTLIRVLLALLGVATLGIIGTAFFKMSLYIEQYGLTLMRVYPTCFMVILFAVFLVMIAAQFRQLPALKICVCISALSVLLLSFANVPGLVAKGNVDRYLTGGLKSFDMEQYNNFPYEAAPHLLRLYEQTDDSDIRSDIHTFAERTVKKTGQSDRPVYGKPAQRIQAEKLLHAFVNPK